MSNSRITEWLLWELITVAAAISIILGLDISNFVNLNGLCRNLKPGL